VSEKDALAEVARKIGADTRGFTGGGVDLFAEVGRFTLTSLQDNGLSPDSRVLDLGCGALRLGYWLVRYLDPDRYYGIEPNRKYVQAGLRHAIGPELEAAKRSRFHYAGDFDFSVFDIKFNFIVARSIFSHAPPEAFCGAMQSFCDNSTVGAVMLASYRPMRKRDPNVDFIDPNPDGPDWRLRRYSLDFLQRSARDRGLTADNYGAPFNGQVWLRLSK
jgi:hypothetical protein